MTANLLNGGADPADLGRVLDELTPDVVVAQELVDECADELRKRYRHYFLHPADDYTGRGVATNLDAEFGDIQMPQARLGLCATLDVAGRPWNLAGVHLFNPIEFPWWTSVSGRSQQLSAIEAWADRLTTGPVLVAGDFNASPRWPAYKRMSSRWDDLLAISARKLGKKPERTWSPRPGWPRLLRIDHVFGSGVTPTGAVVERIIGTDHAAVIVDLVASESHN